MKATITALAAAMLLIAGCGAGASSQPSASLTPSSAPASSGSLFTVPTKTFQSAQLGIAFSYPASWRLDYISMSTSPNRRNSRGGADDFARHGEEAFVVRGPKGVSQQVGMVVHVVSEQFSSKKPPHAYTSVSAAEVAYAHKHERQAKYLGLIKLSLVTVDGLRLIAADLRSKAPYWGGHGRWYSRHLVSGNNSGTMLTLNLCVPASRWRAEQALMNAILASMRFSTPTGGWPGS